MSDKITEAQQFGNLQDDEEFEDLTSTGLDVNDEDQETGTDESQGQGEDTTPALPEKFKGKSIADIVSSYENLEREFGRKNNEVGELRKLADQLLKLERPTKKEETEEESIDSESFIENPTEAIKKILDSDPTIKDIRESQIKAKREKDLALFESQHSDWKEVMATTDFLDWVQKSPLRLQSLLEADQKYDYVTGAALLDDFKSSGSYKTPESKAADNAADTAKREKDLKAVTTEKKSTSQGTRRKIYSRAQLIQLQIENPDEYERRFDEFQKAYEEGRVK